MEAIGPAVWAVGRFLWSGWLATKILLFKKILKLCNSPSNLFFECLNRFLALLSMDSFQRFLLQVCVLGTFFSGSHNFPWQSLLLSTTVLNDILLYVRICMSHTRD